jgi:ribosomal protein S18 acetylase RimI-like enzyme
MMDTVVPNVFITTLPEEEIDLLQNLVDQFVSSHRSLHFRGDYWPSFQNWLSRTNKDENSIVLAAKSSGKVVGFAIGTIMDNGPLLFPERIGYINLMVVSHKSRRKGIGDALWNGLKDRFLSKGIQEIELYTERGNVASETFWERLGFWTFLNRRRVQIAAKS